MKIIKCKYPLIRYDFGQHDVRLSVVILEDHYNSNNLKAGDEILTSKLKMIDFERKIAMTKNTAYWWE